MARRVAYAILEDREDADDAAQDGFLSAWKAIARYDSRKAFRPWLMQIVVNAARDLRRRRRVRAADPLDVGFAGGARRPGPGGRGYRSGRTLADRPGHPARSGSGWRWCCSMPKDTRRPRSRRMLGIPEGTVKSDVFHGRRALRRVLGTSRRSGMSEHSPFDAEPDAELGVALRDALAMPFGGAFVNRVRARHERSGSAAGTKNLPAGSGRDWLPPRW